jgi:hypothetical protein
MLRPGERRHPCRSRRCPAHQVGRGVRTPWRSPASLRSPGSVSAPTPSSLAIEATRGRTCRESSSTARGASPRRSPGASSCPSAGRWVTRSAAPPPGRITFSRLRAWPSPPSRCTRALLSSCRIACCWLSWWRHSRCSGRRTQQGTTPPRSVTDRLWRLQRWVRLPGYSPGVAANAGGWSRRCSFSVHRS